MPKRDIHDVEERVVHVLGNSDVVESLLERVGPDRKLALPIGAGQDRNGPVELRDNLDNIGLRNKSAEFDAELSVDLDANDARNRVAELAVEVLLEFVFRIVLLVVLPIGTVIV